MLNKFSIAFEIFKNEFDPLTSLPTLRGWLLTLDFFEEVSALVSFFSLKMTCCLELNSGDGILFLNLHFELNMVCIGL